LLPEQSERIEAGTVVLEIGAGEGRGARALAGLGARVCAIDLRAPQLRRFIARDSGIDLCAGRAEELPLRAECVDLVVLQTTAMHLRLDPFLDELGRVLRPEGRLLLVEPLAYHPLVALYRCTLSAGRLSGARCLTRRDLGRIAARFESVRISYHGLLAAAAASEGAVSIDRRLLRSLPWLRRLAWFVRVRAEGPRPLPSRGIGDAS